MRSLEEYNAAKQTHLEHIKRLEEEDALFPNDPVHERAINGAREAIHYIERQIQIHHI